MYFLKKIKNWMFCTESHSTRYKWFGSSVLGDRGSPKLSVALLCCALGLCFTPAMTACVLCFDTCSQSSWNDTVQHTQTVNEPSAAHHQSTNRIWEMPTNFEQHWLRSLTKVLGQHVAKAQGRKQRGRLSLRLRWNIRDSVRDEAAEERSAKQRGEEISSPAGLLTSGVWVLVVRIKALV